jgi:CRISPR-associated endonuclease Cas2
MANKINKRSAKIKNTLSLPRGELTLNILEHLLRISEGTIDSFISQKELYNKIRFDNYEATKFCNHLRSMMNSGYVEIERERGIGSVKLTNKGRIKLIENSRKERTDGKWRMLSFDIPEKFSKKRNQFRRSIKRVGFKQVQKSLWACPYVDADEIELIISELAIKEYVAYMIVEKTDIDKYLNKLFADG